MIDDDNKIPFWQEVGKSVRQAGKEAFPDHPTQSAECRFIMQLSHSGRQQDNGGYDNKDKKALSSTSKSDYFHGILCRSMTKREVLEVIKQFADAAERAQKAGLDGVELHGANGYLFTQFLSSAINDRTDEYGGSLRGRAKFLLDVIDAIRQRVGDRFHLQLKTNAEDHDNALYPWRKRGNGLEDAISICNWAVEQGVDALHISSGSIFPHPRNPPGDFPRTVAIQMYPHILDAGVRTRLNYWIFRNPILGPLFRYWWNKRRGIPYEKISDGINLDSAAKIKQALVLPSGLPDGVTIPVIATGGFQHARVIREAISGGKIDGVSIARPLVANRDLPKLFMSGMDWEDASYIPDDVWPIENRNPCSYCNKCLFHDLNDLLGCYDLDRFASREEMVEKVNEVAQSDF
jgi:2,4-dienoyl-CoA reductase (NADPH2)